MAIIKLNACGQTGGFDLGGSRREDSTVRRRFHRAAVLVLPLILAGLAFSTSVAQASGDTAQAWGYNGNGELGNGSFSTTGCLCLDTPGAVSGLSAATQVAAGPNHSLALLSDGTARAWGFNHFGQLGDGTTMSKATPVAVGGLSSAVAIAAGGNHNLALLSDGTVRAWGANAFGQLGNGTTTTTGCGCIQPPVAVSGLSGVVAIAAGGGHSLALLSDGTVRAWGYNGFGQLGDGTRTNSSTPVAVSGLSGVIAIGAGNDHSLALLADGTVRAWGYNADGELGNGTSTGPDICGTTPCSKLPVAVSALSGVSAIATTSGGGHSLALLSDETLKAWGYNAFGQVGNGTSSEALTPVTVSGISGPTTIAAGSGHSLALFSDRTVQAWGENDDGQLGDGTSSGPDTCGTTPCSTVPVVVGGLSGATTIAGGGFHSLALVGPAQRLGVDLAGAGAGEVGSPEIRCPPSCSHTYPQGAVSILRAQAAPGTGFAGWSGACSGTAPCQANLSQDQSVTATFGPPKGTKITKAKINKRKRQARFSFTAPGAITGFKCELVKPRRKHHKKPKARFRKCSSPRTYKHLRAGKYTFKVAALDILGADATPAHKKFKVRP